MKRTPFKVKPRISPSQVKKKRKVTVAGHESVKDLKKEIQRLLREICLIRDKKCILHGIRCYHTVGMEGIVWQAEHLIERSNSGTYADTRLVVLVCKNCHGWKHFKKSNHDQYDRWVKTRLSSERVMLWTQMEILSTKPYPMRSYDWKLCIVALKQELEKLKQL